MNLILNNLRIPVEMDGRDEYRKAASQKLNVSETAIHIVKMLSKSLDAGNKEQFFYEIALVVQTSDSFDNKDNLPVYTDKTAPAREPKNSAERPVIIGFGPAGMFAALELIAYGLKPIIFERGKKIEERSLDVQKFKKEKVLDPESNIQFGEGGAGSYSDGKLFSRRVNTEYISKVLDTFIQFGAPEEIGFVSKPHLGTDVLCKIVRNIRNYILEQGGEIHYCSKMTDILLSDNAVVGVVINGKKEYHCSSIYLAVGHSARDTFAMLHTKGMILEQKPISVGVRVEHPVEIINRMRYGEKYKDFPGIGAALYSLNYTDRKIRKGVYTFCMCPGGEVINASSDHGMMVVNGMSYSRRASAFSNAGIVVTCKTDDYPSAGPLAGVEFQKDIEGKAFHAGGGKWAVPAQNLVDFLSGKASNRLNENSCATGTVPVDMKEIFPAFVSDALVAAFMTWKKTYPLFVSPHAILIGAETRTSAPLRITRSEKFESVNIRNLYPIGEGSGYTGGITSSAADAIRAVEAVLSAR
ncbi:MAG TPA: dehydrogenase [Nitrospiraceae bacterium]|nr:dehydrogenase [Nitrospiraceae bacterium]